MTGGMAATPPMLQSKRPFLINRSEGCRSMLQVATKEGHEL